MGGDHTLSRDAFGVGLCDYRQRTVDKRSRRKSVGPFTLWLSCGKYNDDGITH